MKDLTAIQRDMLYVIASMDAPKGLAIKDELEKYYNIEVHHGQLYPNLDNLAEKGPSRKATRTTELTLIG